ncbi:Flagellar motor switch protein FliN [Candidatus Magnetaquicoccaceae bacterium FCR-1]|uniref:Flagellar motor switch protein FliN n=2 Tax=Candidatus Magnetaquiglobus chichijimensis TaxID=3141448 RepID=A0ABQ0C5F8_9PROT
MDDTGALLDPNILKELELGGGGGGERASSGSSSTVVNEKNMELLMDVSLEISVRLGQVKMQIRDLLKLNKGSLIELGREADDPLEIHVNNRLLAYGEVVMIKDKLGIRITDIVSLSERLENLRR